MKTLDRDVGIILMVFFLSGFIGCQVNGLLLDRFGAYKVIGCIWYAGWDASFIQFYSIAYRLWTMACQLKLKTIIDMTKLFSEQMDSQMDRHQAGL